MFHFITALNMTDRRVYRAQKLFNSYNEK